nr:SHOCT domain-containing protein [Natronomonas sp. LN261]
MCVSTAGHRIRILVSIDLLPRLKSWGLSCILCRLPRADTQINYAHRYGQACHSGRSLYRWLVGGGRAGAVTDPALEELRMAYARGDLSEEEFEERRERLRQEE